MSLLRPRGEDRATSVARSISRRRFLERSLHGLTTGAVALVTTGTILRGSAAASTKCLCAPPNGVYCENCPSGRKRNKCPKGYQRCRTRDGVPECRGCVYDDAWWVSCVGLGEGLGYRTCTDCWIPEDCETGCGCKSDVICGECRTPADVRATMALAMSGDD